MQQSGIKLMKLGMMTGGRFSVFFREPTVYTGSGGRASQLYETKHVNVLTTKVKEIPTNIHVKEIEVVNNDKN